MAQTSPLTNANVTQSEDGTHLVMNLKTQDDHEIQCALTDLTALQLADLLLHNTIRRAQAQQGEQEGEA